MTGAVKRGSFTVPVKTTEGFKVGEWVVVKAATPKLDAELMAGLQPDPTWTRIIKDGSSISELHQVKEIQGESLILKEPVLVNLGADFEAKVSPVNLIEQVGVEDMALQGGWRGRLCIIGRLWMMKGGMGFSSKVWQMVGCADVRS